MAGKRKDWLDRFAPIETSVLRGSHPKVVGLTPTQRCVYYAVLGLCRDLCREVIPSIYCEQKFKHLSEELHVNARTLARSLDVLVSQRLLYWVKSTQNGQHFATIGVAKLQVKWPWLEFKDPHLPLDSSDSSEMEMEMEVEVKEGANAPASPFYRVYEILNSIELPAYRRVKAEPEWERDLADVIADPGRGLDLPGLIAEAKKFRTWFEESVRTGKIKHSELHRPRHRFVNGWLRKCTPGGSNNGRSQPSKSFIQQVLRDTATRQA